MEFFEQAIEADPSFIRAYYALARCYGNLAFYGSLNPEEAYPRALELANQVLNLDNFSGEAYDILGTVNLFYRFNFAAAEEDFRKAIALEPTMPEILKSYSELLFYKGKFRESTEMDRQALLLDPMYPFEDGLFGVHLYFAGQKDSAISLLRRVSSQKEGMTLFLGIMMLYEGDYEQSIHELEKTLSDFSPFSIVQLGLAYSRSGAMEEVGRMLDTLETRAKTQYVPYSLRGALKAELGHKKEAMDYLRRGFEKREEHILLMLHVDTLSYASLRSDPAFREIMEKVRTGT
jgi:serine/threonine-protein kinase